MGADDFDVVVVGTGPAASTVATQASSEGHRVAVIEERDFGGTCALRGCNPKKVYTQAAALVDALRQGRGHGIAFSDLRIVWKDLHAFKEEFTEPVRNRKRDSLREQGIETIHATARFIDRDRMVAGERELTAKRFVIATGATPVPLEIPGAEWVTTSDHFLDLEELPSRIAFVGGGYVSMEFAHVATTSGADVTVLERRRRILSPFDADLVQQLCEHSRQKGMRIETGSEVTEVAKVSHGLQVNYQRDTTSSSLECDLAVHGAGRVPNLRSLNLDAADVRSNPDGIEVDLHLRSTTNPRVFAAGDCAASDQPKLTPVANEEARIVAENLFEDSPTRHPDYGVVPQVAFTSPPIASVGLSEKAARQRYDVEIRHEDTSDWGSVRKSGHRCAGFKTLVDKRSDRIVGAHVLGPGAEEIVNLFALALKFELTRHDLKSVLIAFPTFASDVRRMV